MSNGKGPPDKWYKLQVSTTSDPQAQTSDQVLDTLNAQYPITAAFALKCSDGTFVFIGVYNGH